MQAFETRLTEKGQVTIPLEIRQLIGLRPRDLVHFEVVEGEVRISRVASKLLAGFGNVTPIYRPEDFRSTREEFEKGIAKEVASEG